MRLCSSAIPEPSPEVGKYAPKMLQTKVPVDKIREVIGQGGKVIQKISADCQVKIDINDDGNVFISGVDINNARKALQIVNTIANDPEIGAIYRGKVVNAYELRCICRDCSRQGRTCSHLQA